MVEGKENQRAGFAKQEKKRNAKRGPEFAEREGEKKKTIVRRKNHQGREKKKTAAVWEKFTDRKKPGGLLRHKGGKLGMGRLKGKKKSHNGTVLVATKLEEGT